MATAERVVLIVCLFGGFLWLRSRARSLDLSRRQGRVVFGILLLLGLLLAEKSLFEMLPQGTVLTLAIKALALAATFAAIGYGFLRPSPPGDGESGIPGAPVDPGPGDSAGQA